MSASRWQSFSSSIFAKMSQLAMQYQAINLAQGFPDFDGPEAIKDAAIEAIRSGFNQYAPAFGLLDLRLQLAARQSARYQLDYDPEHEITIFSGASEALFCSMLGLVGPGDEVICFEPFFDCYPADIAMAGASLRSCALHYPDWGFDRAEFAALFNTKTKVLLLNTPHNPTGKVFTQDELSFIAGLVEQYQVTVVTDEVYEELVFAPAQHVPFAQLPGMRERTITISSTAKTFSMTGWKIGFAFAPANLTRLIRIPHLYTVFCSATPLQAGMITALKLDNSYFETFRQGYTERRALLLQILQSVGFRCKAPEGAYFIVADYRQLRDIEDLEFAEWLTRELGVACIPTSSFYADAKRARREQRLVRFAFCKEKATIEIAGQRLRQGLAAGSF